MSFDEFLELCSFNNTYFVSGCIAFVIENHSQFNCVHEAIARKRKQNVYIFQMKISTLSIARKICQK